MNNADLEKRFNDEFRKFLADSNTMVGRDVTRFQGELMHFFRLGAVVASETEQGRVVEGNATMIESKGNRYAYTVEVPESVKLNDVLGVVVRGEEKC